jgi:hypothetical protein
VLRLRILDVAKKMMRMLWVMQVWWLMLLLHRLVL